MNRPGDGDFESAVDAPCDVSFTYEDIAGVAIDVTGYSARAQLLVFNGTRYGRELYTPTIAVGGVNGEFTTTLSTAQLSALLAASPPGEPARYRVFVTGPAGLPPEIELAHGAIRILPPGAAVSDADFEIVSPDFSVTVHAVGARGPAGDDGAAGPPGDDGPPGADGPEGPTAVKTPAGVEVTLSTGERLRFDSGFRLNTLPSGDVMVSRGDLLVATEHPYYACGSETTVSATTTNGSPTVTVASNPVISDGGREWRYGHGIMVPGAGAAHGMTIPAAPVLTLATWTGNPVTTGSVTYEAVLIAISPDLGYTAVSDVATIVNAPDYMAASIGNKAGWVRTDIVITTPITLGTNSRFWDGRRSADEGTSSNNYLITAQAATADNGGYDTSGPPNDAQVTISTRLSDFNTVAEMYLGRRIRATLGDTAAGTWWRVALAPVTLGVSPVTIVEETVVRVSPYLFDAEFVSVAAIANLAAVPTNTASIDRESGASAGTMLLLDTGNVVLYKDDPSGALNGLYVCGVPAAGLVALTRVTAYNQTAEMKRGTVIRVRHGNAVAKRCRSYWIQNSVAPAIVDTTPVTYQKENWMWLGVFTRINAAATGFRWRGAMNAEPYWLGATTVAPVCWNDHGEGAMSAPETFLNTAPVAQRNNSLFARITDVTGGSFTTLTLDTSASASVTATQYHENSQAFELMHAEDFPFGGANDGIPQLWPPAAGYQFFGNRGIKIRRTMTLSGYARSTHFKFLAGANMRVFGTNTVDNPDGTNAPYTLIENLDIDSEFGLPEGGKYVSPGDDDLGGGTIIRSGQFHGALIHCNTRTRVENVLGSTVMGNGLVVDGRDVVGAIASLSYYFYNSMSTCRGHAYIVQGSDGNAGVDMLNSAFSCYSDGHQLRPFLNWTSIAPHSEAIGGRGLSLHSTVACYSPYLEGGLTESYVGDAAIILGGFHGTSRDPRFGFSLKTRTSVSSFEVLSGPRDNVRRPRISIGARSTNQGIGLANDFASGTPGLNVYSQITIAESSGAVVIRDASSVSVNHMSFNRHAALTGVSAAFAVTNLYSANPGATEYEVGATISCTTADGTGIPGTNTVRVRITWDGLNGSESLASAALDLTASAVSVQLPMFLLHSDSTHNIQYSLEVVTGAIGAGRIALDVFSRRVGFN